MVLVLTDHVIEILLGFEWFDIAVVLLDVPHDLELSCRVKCIAGTAQELHQVGCHVAAAHVHSLSRVRDRVAFVDGTSMCDAVATVKHNTSGQSACIERKYCLRLEEQVGNAKSFEEHFRGVDAIADGIVGRFSQQHAMFSWVDFELIEDVSPDGLHLLPVADNSMLNRVVKLDNAFVFLRLLPDEELVLFECIDHDLLVLRTTNTSRVNRNGTLTMS